MKERNRIFLTTVAENLRQSVTWHSVGVRLELWDVPVPGSRL